MPFQVLILMWVSLYTFRILWDSPVNSAVWLGVSPTATTPTYFFTARRFDSLVSCTETLGFTACLSRSPIALPGLYACKCGLPTWSATLPCYVSSPPWLPLSAPPPTRDECVFNSLVVGPPCKWFTGSCGCFFFYIGCHSSFGCAKKWSISAYVSILAGTPWLFYSSVSWKYYL